MVTCSRHDVAEKLLIGR